MKTLMIIGGGAAGLSSAVQAARLLRAQYNVYHTRFNESDFRIELVEADERVGRSILATGNGRCNFSNAAIEAAHYRNAAFVRMVFANLRSSGVAGASKRAFRSNAFHDCENDPVHRFFSELGLCWRVDDMQRMYPRSNKASSVLDVLRCACSSLGVAITCNARVVGIDAPQHVNDRFHVRFADGAVAHADALVLAVGARALDGIALPECLAIRQTEGVLGPLRASMQNLVSLDNIRVKAGLWLFSSHDDPSQDAAAGKEDAALAARQAYCAWQKHWGSNESYPSMEDLPARRLKAFEEGEVLFRKYGVSGIAAFNISRFADPLDVLLVDLAPELTFSECVQFLRAQRNALLPLYSSLDCFDLFRGLLLPRVAFALISQADLEGGLFPDEERIYRLAAAMKGLRLEVAGRADISKCQAARGGLSVDGFSPSTLESLCLPGFFACGEALDVDGPCGGYNLHWAWSSGLAAAKSSVHKLITLAKADI